MSQLLDSSPQGVRERSPIVELLLLAAPGVAQQVSYVALQFTDALMLSRVSDTAATAAGNAGMFAWSFVGFGMGVLMLVNTLVSQAFGRKDFSACGRFMWQGVWLSVILWLVVLPVLPFASLPFKWSGHELELARQETLYFQIVTSVCVLKLLATALGQFLLAINMSHWVMIATIIGVVFNVLGNWLLIFGNWGFPRMEIAGAAWATNAAVLLECGILIIVCLWPSVRRTYHTLAARPNGAMIAQLTKLGAPAGAQFVADVLAWTLFMMTVLGAFGTATMAGNQYAFRFWTTSFMPAFGIAQAVTALVGRYIGAGRPDIAAKRAHLGFVVAAIYMMTMGALFFIFRHDMISLFTDDPEVIKVGATVLLFAAVFQIFDATYIVYSSALRGAGDTLVPAIAVIALNWTLVVGGGLLVSRMFPQLTYVGPWIMATIFGALLSGFMLRRFLQGGWKDIKLHKGPELLPPSQTDPASATVPASV